ncbi:hypothetical protein AN191_17545 [Loktanella sp. 5RATIMAR09]|uniref:hypothetical protein n=1 Tax=Loktanella sp. 5RATIMAR09 TaxID=1225655 RepID=UPI0006EB7B8C|nr:hypothetical protein [Loktanella sp. 5RATIMAR09]KQI70513.1 hypothetical protein AN191_17545 [Loktanella sp. 5RATIMAR09]
MTHVFQFALDPADIQYPRIEIRNTHNIVLQLLLNWGLIGNFLIIGIAFAFVRNFCAAMTQMPDRAIFPLVVLATMLVHSLVSGVFFYPYSTIVGIIAFASLTAGGRQENSLYPNR